MKKNTHPNYQSSTFTCACGNILHTQSTVFPAVNVEICSACHPFFTGKQKFVDVAGRIEKFQKRYRQ